MEVSKLFLNKMCVGNGDVTSCYRDGELLQLVHIYYDSNKTRETCSYWLLYTFGSIYVFLQNC